jgi:hypothetical protein
MSPGVEGAVNKPVGYARYGTLTSAIDLIGNPAPGVNANNHLGPAGTMKSPVRALLQADTQDIRFTDDGTVPTSANGMKLVKDVVMEYEGDLMTLKFIEVTAGAILHVLYYRY